MPKITSIVLIFALLIVGILTVSFAWNQNTKTMKNLVVNNNLEKRGITLIPSASSDFDTEIAASLRDNYESATLYVDAIKPLTVFVKNTSTKDVVGISLLWEIAKADGSIQIIPQAESAPEPLMGIKSRNPVTRGSLIPSNSSRFFALDNNIQSLVRSESENLIWKRPSSLTGEKIKQLQNYLPELQVEKQKMTSEAVNISVSIDGIFFSDGTFVGVDRNYLFAAMKASIQAQKDFTKEVRETVKVKKSAKEIFNWFESLASERPSFPDRFNDETEKFDYSYKVELYYSAKQALLKKQKWTESEIIEKIISKTTDDSVLLRKEDL